MASYRYGHRRPRARPEFSVGRAARAIRLCSERIRANWRFSTHPPGATCSPNRSATRSGGMSAFRCVCAWSSRCWRRATFRSPCETIPHRSLTSRREFANRIRRERQTAATDGTAMKSSSPSPARSTDLGAESTRRAVLSTSSHRAGATGGPRNAGSASSRGNQGKQLGCRSPTSCAATPRPGLKSCQASSSADARTLLDSAARRHAPRWFDTPIPLRRSRDLIAGSVRDWPLRRATTACLDEPGEPLDSLLPIPAVPVRIVSSSTSTTPAMVESLVSSSGRTGELVWRARRRAAGPSQASSLRSCRDQASRTPARKMRRGGSRLGRFGTEMNSDP